MLATLLHPDDARRFSEAQLPKILAAGDDDTFVNLFRMKHQSGEWRWFRSHARIFSRTPSGTPTQMVGTAHDVTAEREYGQALALATTAVTAAANGIVVTDANATIVWANPAFCSMTGYRHDEVVGFKPSVLKSGLQDDAFYRDLWQTILDGRVWRGQLINRRRDGSQYVEAMTITPVAVDGDRITHFVAVKSDVTREQQMEQRLRVAERMEAVGQLASGVAHDFNNMVTVVLGYCTLLLDQFLDTDPRRADVVAIMSANERAASLTRQLLAFSRKQPLAPKSVDLNALLADARALLKRLLRGDIELDVKLSPAPVLAHVDSVQLERAIVNLVVNARDSIAGGGLRGRTHGDDDGRRRVGGRAARGRGRHLRLRPGERQRQRDVERGAEPHLRALLHDQSSGQRHRPWPGHRLRVRQAVERLHLGQQHARAGHDIHAAAAARSAGRGRQPRTTAGRRRALHRPPGRTPATESSSLSTTTPCWRRSCAGSSRKAASKCSPR